MITIIYVSNANLPLMRANAIHIMRMCDAFVKNGVNVELYCDEKGVEEKMYSVYGVNHKFPIFSPKRKRIFGGIKGFANVLLCSWKNAQKIKRESGSVYIYGRSLPTLFFLGGYFPFFYEVHALPTNRILAWMERCVLKRRNLMNLITISGPLKDYYANLLPELPEKKIMVLHDGANVVKSGGQKINLLNNTGSRYPNINVGYIGSLYPGKCMEVLLPVAQAIPDILIHVIGGDSEWVNHWKNEAEKKNIENLVFYGKVAPAEVPSYYESLDICLMPFSNKIYVNKNCKLEIGKWISPLKLFEAMAYGKAIVVTDLPSIREVIDDGEDAILMDASDISGWVAAIEKLSTSFQLRQHLAAKAKEKLENRYSWDNRTQTIINSILK